MPKRVLFSGQHLAIDDCVAMGLVDMVATEAALTAAQAYAAAIAANAPLSVAGSKLILEAIAHGYGRSLRKRGDRGGHRSRDDKFGLSRGRASFR